MDFVKQRYSTEETGTTLLELLITVTTLAIVLVSVPIAFRGGTQVWEKGDRHAETLQNALIGMEQMTRDLRQGKSIIGVSTPGESSGYIQFEDRDGNNRRYRKVDGYLSYRDKQLSGPIDSLKFTCYEEDGATQTTVLDEIRSVEIQMYTADSENKVNSIPLSSRVYIRNWPEYSVIDDFAIFGQDGVTLGENVTLGSLTTSNVGSNGDIYLTNGVDINGEVIYNGDSTVGYQNPDQVNTGSVYRALINLPPVTDFSGFAYVDEEVSLKNNKTWPPDGEDIIPGSYGHLDMGNGCTMILTSDVSELPVDSPYHWHFSNPPPGTSSDYANYYFASITAGNKLNLVIDLTSGNGINIFVEGDVTFGNLLVGTDSLSVTLEGGDAAQIYAETHSRWEMGQNVQWFGTIYAPLDDIEITDGTIYGALYSDGMAIIHNVSSINFVRSDYLANIMQ